MSKKTGTSHNGRFGSEKHNGRDFDVTKAKHIRPERVKDNAYWFWDKDSSDGLTFAGAEERYYTAKFCEGLAAQNDRHIAGGHASRIKTMQDWLKGRNTCPEESIYQIGNKDDKDIDPDDLAGAVGKLCEWLEDWSKKHGEPFKILSVAIHKDETSYHAQVRRVWQYQDADGNWMIGQSKALEAAGVELPDPSQKRDRKNNRKVTFDRMVREKWLDICESYGYEMEREPNPKHTEHLTKEQYIELQERKEELEREYQQKTAELERQYAQKIAELGETTRKAEEAARVLRALTKDMTEERRRERLQGVQPQIRDARFAVEEYKRLSGDTEYS